MDMFLNRLKQSYDKVSGWSKEKVATVKAGMADAEACCAEVGTSVAGVCGRVSRRMKSYNNTAPDKRQVLMRYGICMLSSPARWLKRWDR